MLPPLFCIFFLLLQWARSSCPDYTSVDQLHDLSPHSRVLHMVLQRLRVTLGLLQYTLHHRVSHDFLQKSPKNSSASCRARITSVKKKRTAISGSRIARSIVSCSVSFARCALIALCILNESSWISRVLFDPAASSCSRATSSASSALVYSRSANKTLPLRMYALTSKSQSQSISAQLPFSFSHYQT